MEQNQSREGLVVVSVTFSESIFNQTIKLGNLPTSRCNPASCLTWVRSLLDVVSIRFKLSQKYGFVILLFASKFVVVKTLTFSPRYHIGILLPKNQSSNPPQKLRLVKILELETKQRNKQSNWFLAWSSSKLKTDLYLTLVSWSHQTRSPPLRSLLGDPRSFPPTENKGFYYCEQRTKEYKAKNRNIRGFYYCEQCGKEFRQTWGII